MQRSGAPLRRLLVLGVLAGAALTAWMVRSALERRAVRAEVDAIRGELLMLRVSSADCQTALAEEELLFRHFAAEVDSLRDAVRRYEALDVRGVPGEQYQTYLELFDRYNRSVPEWRRQAEALQMNWEACHGVAQAHNVLADSLRRRVEALTRD